MSQTIEVESLRLLDVKPHETLVIILPDDMNQAEFHRSAELLRDLFADTKTLIVNSRVDLRVAETRSLEDITSQAVGR